MLRAALLLLLCCAAAPRASSAAAIPGAALPGGPDTADRAAWLPARLLDPDVAELEQGVLYKPLHAGDGGDSPTPSDLCHVQLRITLPDGRVVDQSHWTEPARFLLSQALGGLQVALRWMRAGDSWEVYVPPALGFPAVPRTVGKWAAVGTPPAGPALDWYFPRPPDPSEPVWVPAAAPLNITVRLVS
eukprot:EG_transcript_33585